MERHYSDLATSSLRKAFDAMTDARQYASDAEAPEWIIKNMKKLSSGIRNRIEDILHLRKPDKE